MKRYLALLGASMFFVACFSLYLMLENVSSTPGSGLNDGISSIELKIQQIEDDLKKNHETINLIKDTVRNFADGDSKHIADLQRVLDSIGNKQLSMKEPYKLTARPHYDIIINTNLTRKVEILSSPATCVLAQQSPPATDIQMMEVYENLPFDNVDGGSWKQGFPISYDAKQYIGSPLQVFVIPHSHCDPGWLKTYERYYTEQVRHILNNMVDKLEQYPAMRFIYAEMSFFSLWWSEISDSKKARVKKLLSENRLEIVTGGWVMNDEANTHYSAMVEQLVEGNQWLLNQLGVKPQSGWAIDPFGHSPTMAYLLHKMGLSNMLIQRTHYATKKYLAQHKQLEFLWRQNWDHDGSTDMLCHMMPFYSYDVPHTCGPEPAICCQFDFKRLPGGKVACPWKIPPQPITIDNVQHKAEILLDQYRKKSQLYQNNVLLVPLGDDFRYDKTNEWDQQYTNYEKLFDYMNSRDDWNVKAQFGTLTDYFNALHARAGVDPSQNPTSYPVLSGDFFTYSDREDDYWSGYFTSKPFYKRMDRELEAHLRGAEILFSQAVMYSRHMAIQTLPVEHIMKQLVSARRSLGLYQHHDGVTGTAKDFVMTDYGNKMLQAIMNSKNIVRDAAQFLLTDDKSQYTFDHNAPVFDVDEQRVTYDALPDRTLLTVTDQPKMVMFYNSLGHTRTVMVRVYISVAHVEVQDNNGHIILSQVDPFWNNLEVIADNKFKLILVVTVPAFGMNVYTIREVPAHTNPSHTISEVVVYNNVHGASPQGSRNFQVSTNTGTKIYLENQDIKVQVSTSTGTLQDIILRESGDTLTAHVQFMTYGVMNQKERSGAYLFLPDGQAKPLSYSEPFMRLMRGPLSTEVHSFLPLLQHQITLYNSPGLDSLSVDIHNIVDITQQNNKELVMRVSTNIDNKDGTFYSDLNGFQLQERKTYKKLPLQANYYPMPTMSYIEDDQLRFSIFSGQSLGCASLQTGWLEVMQDRRLSQDDNRGLGQGVQDNKKTINRFKFLMEKRLSSKQFVKQRTGFPSMIAHLSSHNLLHPVVVMPQSATLTTPLHLHRSHTPLMHDLSCDLHLVNLRTMQNPEHDSIKQFQPQDEIGMILHRLGVDCSFPVKGVQCPLLDGQVAFAEFFKDLTVSSVQNTSLSFIHNHGNIDTSTTLHLPPMELQAYKLVVF